MLAMCAGPLVQTRAANLPVNMPKPAPAKATSAPTMAPAPTTATPPTSQDTPSAPTANEVSSPPPPLIQLPLAFADFAADYHPQELHPEWLTVQVATLETVFSPPQDKTTFVLSELPAALTELYQPMEISCLLGAKSRFENVTQIDVDPRGHPLGYSVPLGKLAYVLAREVQPEGINFSLHYYEAGQLRWQANPEKNDWFIPATQATAITQNLLVPIDRYVFFFISSRFGPPRPDSTARPQPLYTYLILHVHPLVPAAPAMDAAGATTSPP